MVPEIVLDEDQKFSTKAILASLVRQSEVTHLVERGLTDELDHVHARDNRFFLLDIAGDRLKIGISYYRLFLLFDEAAGTWLYCWSDGNTFCCSLAKSSLHLRYWVHCGRCWTVRILFFARQ